jgi:hypothetical protein
VGVTNHLISLVARKRAVLGCAARTSSSCRASLFARAVVDVGDPSVDDLVPEGELPARHVQARVERPAHPVGRARVVDERPAREALRDLSHVGLAVAAGEAQRVQLHHLARVVLLGRAAHVEPVVEVIEHRPAEGRGPEHRGERAERVLADDGPVELRQQHPLDVVLVVVDREVVVPELDHALEELAAGLDGARDRGELEHEVGPREVRRVGVVQLLRALLQLDEADEPRVEVRVVDREMVELLLEVRVVSHRLRALVLGEREALGDALHQPEHRIAVRRDARRRHRPEELPRGQHSARVNGLRRGRELRP